MIVVDILRGIYDWAEVWALLIPLSILIIRKPKADWVEPIKWYLIIALLLNIAIDFMWYVNKYYLWRDWGYKKSWNNNIIYNTQSIVRLFCFTWFFMRVRKQDKRFIQILQAIFILATIFFLYHRLTYINSYVLASEAGLLLTCCLWFTVNMIWQDSLEAPGSQPSNWIVGGLTLYTSVNFFIFLFYSYLMEYYKTYSVTLWDVHNSLFILLCLSISIALYNGARRK